MNTNVIKKIETLMTEHMQSATRKQLENHAELYERSESYLNDKNHKIAFIGNVGAGKTTSICHLLGLVSNGTPVLSTGSGRTTLCEVHLKHSQQAMVDVEPYTNDEVQSFLLDFALYLKSDNSDADQEGFKLSAEVERAIRNMLDLKIERKKVDGKRIANDFAKVFARDFSRDELINEFNKIIKLEKRTQTRFENDGSEPNLEWLNNTFKQINSATQPNVSLAKKITLYVPELNINSGDFILTFVDTKGVDQTVNRVDLDQCLTDDRTLSVFCTRFNDAPDQTCSRMIDSAIQAGLKSRINSESALLVLDRAGEAEDVMDYEEAVGDKEDGRDIKADQISSELSQKFAVNKLDIEFFDAKQDEPTDLLTLLIGKVSALREHHQARLAEISNSVNEIELELKSESAELAKRQVKMTLEPWLKKSRGSTPTLNEFFLPLVKTISAKGTYAASVRASVNRSGDWHNLDYYQEIASGARAQCVNKIHPVKSDLNTLIENMLAQNELQPAHSLLKQLRNTTDIRIDEIAQLALSRGRSAYESTMKTDKVLWNVLYREWGQGAGYKDRVSQKTHDWFKGNDYSRYEFEVTRALVTKWEKYLEEIEHLIGSNLAS